VPAAIQTVNGSPSSTTAISMVDSGPTVPACAVSEAPIRSMAIITIRTGAKVHSVAFNTESHNTAEGTTRAESGRRIKNCAMQMMQATVVARPVRRSAPRLFTSSPLYDRYMA
jgi:hypothetical protein